MNYRHSYHAGNFADVFKHIVLVTLIKALTHKDNPICYIDTHAGSGVYDLFAEQAQTSKEFELGIKKLFHEAEPPELIKQYLHCVQGINNRLANTTISSLRYYPGSPMILRYFLRAHDRLLLTELHPQECELLRKTFPNDRKVGIHLMDGYLGMKAFLPPKERRSLILIDPPYERPNEFGALLKGLEVGLKRFETGVFAIWYPIKDRASVERFHHDIRTHIQKPLLITELSVSPDTLTTQLNGSGMIIVNPPWQVDKQIQAFLPWLWKVLAVHGQGQFSAQSVG